jgi:hypothetical protein
MSCSPSFFAALLVRCSVCVGVRSESATGKGEGRISEGKSNTVCVCVLV